MERWDPELKKADGETVVKMMDDVVWSVLVDRMTHGQIGMHERRAAPWKLIRGRVEERIGWANRCNFAHLPQEVLSAIYDRMFDLHTAPTMRLVEESHVHELHYLAGEGMGPTIDAWLRNTTTKRRMRNLFKSYRNCEEATAIHENKGFDKHADGSPDITTAVAYNLPAECCECMEFMIKHDIIQITGYDSAGRNWLHAGLASGNVATVNYLVQKMTAAELCSRRDFHAVNEPHILAALVEFGTPGGFEFVFQKIIESFPVESDELQEILPDDILETLICWAPTSLADLLYQHGVNIANVEAKYIPDKQRTITTSWHAAAVYNPEGPKMMEWLQKFSLLSTEVRDAQNLTPLMFAAAYDQVETVEWLCKHSNPMLARDRGGFEAWALVRAARSSDPVSDEIFAIILDYLPQRIFTNMGGKYYGSQIADGLVRHKRALKAGTISEPSRAEAEQIAVRKMKALIGRMSHDWSGSPWQNALTLYVLNRDVVILKHAMAGRTLTTSTLRSRRREPKPTEKTKKREKIVQFASDTRAAYKGLTGRKKRPSVLSSKNDPRTSVIKNRKKTQESASSQAANPVDPQLWI
ncbi:uncharacterized protein N7511_006051 [Penicillium nucicola]|uniref:uncharacterized protein n=1 Tax=Penicillium nucicola TaxID=1850975 RepID=UPI002545968B|nr:uncharacterized protein N7511_006051 [Penicillium nucicola]KAJ5757357.1 hypothetical protein N7511_006051 [Penicillium nucicola]